jgi:5-methylcytosine-specific restriction endonuclease McrA
MKKADRDKVFNKYGGKCAYCGCDLDNTWQVDHAISKFYSFMIEDINHISNLMPACKKCNHYKRSLCIDRTDTHIGFRDYLKSFHKRLAKLPKNTQVKRTQQRKIYMQDIADRYGITVEKPFSGIFYFEQTKTKL